MSGLDTMEDDFTEDVVLQEAPCPTIAEHATQCNSLFQRKMAIADIVPDPTIMDDQLARFTLWANNMDVYGPLNVSLDYRLRYSPTAVQILHQLLDIQYQEHLITEHDVPETHARILSSTARRPILDKILQCPFNVDFQPPEKVEPSPVFASQALQSHIAGHMKEIALLTLQKLPSLEDEQNKNIESDESSDDDGPVLERFRGSMYSVLDDDEDLVFQDGDGDAEATNVDLDLYDPDKLTSMTNLVSTYKNQGRLEEAEKLGIQVLEIRKTKLGAEHPNTLASMANLASIYLDQGHREEAEELEVQVIENREIKFGAGYPNTLRSMADLVSIYKTKGWLKGAAELQMEVIEAYKTKLGADHPKTLASMANLASIFFD
ncbi:ankyrin [Cordyceps javanica]|uniref:Ankyrin n=1 Tax=Cordyceps javanica TaxID=43265 RepID=A0A545VGI1_9HYPO|nr:ankyrin [Cordyceps javanica]TQW12004.1 ankyrin [Cordyceps javanica]